MSEAVRALVKRMLCFDRRGPYGREVCEELVDELFDKGFACLFHPDRKRRVYRYMVLEKWRAMGLLEKRRTPVCGGFGKTRACYYPRSDAIVALSELLSRLGQGALRKHQCIEVEKKGTGPW